MTDRPETRPKRAPARPVPGTPGTAAPPPGQDGHAVAALAAAFRCAYP